MNDPLMKEALSHGRVVSSIPQRVGLGSHPVYHSGMAADYEDLKLCADRLALRYETGGEDDSTTLLVALAKTTEEEAVVALQGGREAILDLLTTDSSEMVVQSYVEANGLRELAIQSV